MNTEQKTEFIREKVIMANNPECKTYEEALEKEEEHNSCQYKIIRGNGEIETGCGYWYHGYSSWDDVDREILGLPINLERLLVALNQGIEEKDEGLFFSTGFEIRKILVDEGYNGKICKWQPNKALEEQSEETIEKIYNILI